MYGRSINTPSDDFGLDGGAFISIIGSSGIITFIFTSKVSPTFSRKLILLLLLHIKDVKVFVKENWICII